MALQLHEADLRPYQTFFIFASPKSLQRQHIATLFAQLKDLLDYGIDEVQERSQVLDTHEVRNFDEVQIGWIVYRRTFPVTWALGTNAPRNTEHHWLAMLVRDDLVSLVATDKAFASKVHRAVSSNSEWQILSKVPQERLEAALVDGAAKTLWLSGIHRSVATKADSKVLMGSNLEASLDALGDQSYHYTSTRCAGPADSFSTATVGVTPRQGKVWLGPTNHWEAFVANSRSLLKLLKGRAKPSTPYPVLARASGTLANIRDAFDISLAWPEALADEDPGKTAELERVLGSVTWEVTGNGGPNCDIAFSTGETVHTIRIELKLNANGITHSATPVGKSDSEQAKELLEYCNRPDLLKIFYESAHTYSDGQVFEVKTRPISFPVTAENFSKFSVTLEKPLPAGKDEGVDLDRIGAVDDESLFTWVYRHFKKGWLWCDDGAGEMADFIHFDQDTLTLIHVKAAHSASVKREISVAAYEVVCSQAVKNLRYLEREELSASLAKKINTDRIARCWKDGKAEKKNGAAFSSALRKARYSDFKRRVIVLQPHVRKSFLPNDPNSQTRDGRQARLFYTLLHGVAANVRNLGAEFKVIVAE